MDIIVTTPKSQIANAAKEAQNCINAGGGYYFRRFDRLPAIKNGGKVWYVEDGYIRGFAVVDHISTSMHHQVCETTGKNWPPGAYIFMKASSWKWVKPIPMKGFQGYRYATEFNIYKPKIVGGWKDPKPNK